MNRIQHANSGTVSRRPLVLLVLLAFVLPACGGDDSGTTPPAKTPAESGTGVGQGTVPGQPATQPKGLPGLPPAPPAVPPETVIVTVNGEPIRQGEIDKEVTRLMGGRPLPPAQMRMYRPQLAAQAEQALVERKLLETALANDTTAVTEDQIATRWSEFEKTLPEGMTRAQFLAGRGVTPEEADKEIRRTIRLERMIEAHKPAEAVTDETVRKHYDVNIKRFTAGEQVRARHILLKVDAGATDEQKAAVKKQMDAIVAELKKEGGKTFEQLAGEHSACPTKAQGGDLGFFGRGRMVPEFDALAFKLEPGVVSDPFLTQFGYHIMEVREKKEARVTPFDEVKARIRTELEMQGKRSAMMSYIASLRETAKIERPAAK